MNKYRLLTGSHTDESNKQYSDNSIICSKLELDKLFQGKFLLLNEKTAPEEALQKGDEGYVSSKTYDVTSKFKSAMRANYTVSKKGKLYFISSLHDIKCGVLNNEDLNSPQAVNEFIELNPY